MPPLYKIISNFLFALSKIRRREEPSTKEEKKIVLLYTIKIAIMLVESARTFPHFSTRRRRRRAQVENMAFIYLRKKEKRLPR